MVEVFVAQNPDRPLPSRPAQIGLKPSSSRTTEAFGQSRPELYRHVTTLLAQRLHDTNDALATNFLSVKGRVARALLSLAEAFGRNIGQGRILIQQKVSQGDLAAMAGIARKNVSRVLHNWANGSLVTRLAGYYVWRK
jgi:CRP/FNR family transcriptional regulator, cyclic AMP receptor protein